MHSTFDNAPAAFALAFALACFSSTARAHDTWIVPDAFQSPPGRAVTATMSAGDGLVALAAPQRTRVISVELIDAKGRSAYTDWKEVDDKQVKVAFGVPAAGVSLLAVTTKDRDIEIEPPKVDQYLAEIHAKPHITEAWARQRARGEAWKEQYAKDAKTYLRSGEGDAGWPQLAALGQTLEMVPTRNPTRLKKGDRFEVVLRLKGQPLADTAIRLYAGAKHGPVVRTDAQGRAAFVLSDAGPHLLATTALNLPAGPGAPWTSRFATLGFGVAE